MLLLGLLPLMLLRGCGCQAADVPEDVTAEFSVRLYHQLQITGGEENIIFSPLSVALALGMVELGARGSSLEEIRQAVGYSHFREGTVICKTARGVTCSLSSLTFESFPQLAETVTPTFPINFLHRHLKNK